MLARRTRWLQLTLFLAAFFLVWTLRATVFYAVDESIASRITRAAYSDLLKLLLWVLPAAAFARVLRKARPARYLGLSVWPGRKDWLVCLGVTAAFLLASALGTMALSGKPPSTTRLTSLPLALWALVALLAPLLEELLFRGLVLRELLALLPRYRAIVLTSVLFVGTHLPYWLSHRRLSWPLVEDTLGVFVFSLVAGWLFARTKSIWPPTVAHIANNLLASTLAASGG
jgi:membrane protease YdiL (CAAX protease family)